jgi:glycosyltransferase involved in cell wall biosynthesis
MRIVIDMQGAQTASRFRGIGRYSMSFAQAVVRNRGEHEVILALSGLFPDTIEPIREAFHGILPQENIRVWHAQGPVAAGQPGNEVRREIAEILREAFLASLAGDLIHVTSFFEGYVDDAVTSLGRFDTNTPTSVTLYDLIPLLNPDQYLKTNPQYEQYYRRKLEFFKLASRFFAISEFSRQEGIAQLELVESDAINVSTAIDHDYDILTLEENNWGKIVDKFKINRDFILYTGATDERKNLPRLIHAYAALPTHLRKSHQLVLAGGLPEDHLIELQSIAKNAGVQKAELVFTNRVLDAELVCLYKLCKLYVFPSWHEGFGLPLLEAMKCGAPVIGANTSSLPEVIGLDEAMFDPFDTNAISLKMQKALTDEAFRNRLRENGMQRVQLFSWNMTAQRAIKAWESIAEANPKGMINDLLTSKHLYETIAPYLSQQGEQALLNISACLALNQPKNNDRQLLVDISELVQRDAKSGIQRVVRNILKEWLTHPPEGYRIEPVYATLEHGYRYARRFTADFLDFSCSGLADDDSIDFAPGDIFFVLDLQPQVQVAQRGYYQFLRRQGVKVIFNVYDLLCVQMPQYFVQGGSEGFEHWLEVVAEADGAICISKAVAHELNTWFEKCNIQRLRPFKTDWYHLGADIDNSQSNKGLPNSANTVLAQLGARPAFLMVGTLEPRKAHGQVLDAFELLWQMGADVNLVVVGKQGWLVEDLVKRLHKHPELNKRLFWLVGVSDEYLEKVYATSICLISASYGEGFGLPLIEAAQHNLPIIARDIPVFREVAGNHAHYFKAEQPTELAQSIEQWIVLFDKGQHPKSDDMPWLTWKHSAAQLLEALQVPRINKISQNKVKATHLK